MAIKKQVNNYLNTLIFCIIAKFVSILLLIGLFVSPYLRTQWTYGILTIVVGLLLIIISSMFSILAYSQKAQNALQTAGNAVVAKVQQQCPMYFTKYYDEANDRVTCCNNYTSPDGTAVPFYSSNGINEMLLHTSNDFLKNTSNLDTICQAVNSASWAYANYPFTDIKEFCRVYQ